MRIGGFRADSPVPRPATWHDPWPASGEPAAWRAPASRSGAFCPSGFKSVKIPPAATGAFTFRGSRLVRLDHGRHRKGGLILPVTGYGDFGYFGAPYDPAEAIPVYAPQPLIQQVDDDPPAETHVAQRTRPHPRARREPGRLRVREGDGAGDRKASARSRWCAADRRSCSYADCDAPRDQSRAAARTCSRDSTIRRAGIANRFFASPTCASNMISHLVGSNADQAMPWR